MYCFVGGIRTGRLGGVIGGIRMGLLEICGGVVVGVGGCFGVGGLGGLLGLSGRSEWIWRIRRIVCGREGSRRFWFLGRKSFVGPGCCCILSRLLTGTGCSSRLYQPGLVHSE